MAARTSNAPSATLPQAVDRLLFCNRPERLTNSGAYASTHLQAGKTYRIFFHYRNTIAVTRPLVVTFQDANGKPFTLTVRKGIAEPSNDPGLAGRQAMARYLQSPTKRLAATNGSVRFPLVLSRWEVASGVIDVRPSKDVRLSIYFGHDRWTVPQAHVVPLAAPRRDIAVTLTARQTSQYVRIGQPDANAASLLEGMDGLYGLFYNIRIQAPAGRTVRIVFSPRGGKSGLVGTLAGSLWQSPLVEAAQWVLFGDVRVGKQELILRTAPFGGVFYPVELAFHLQ